MSNLKARKTQLKAARAERRDGNTCYDCINYMGGSCAMRLNSPDYPSYIVKANDLACDAYNIPSTRIDDPDEREPLFQGMANDEVFYESRIDHGHRKILNLAIFSVPELHRLGLLDQDYPVLGATIQHMGESCVFFLPNTKHVTVSVNGKARRIASNRYDVGNLFTRVMDKGSVKLQAWTRVQFDT